MHRYIARALACLAISLAFTVLVVSIPRVGKKEIKLRTDGQTADIVAAVEALKRSDVIIDVSDDPWVTNPVGGIVTGSLAMAVLLWLASGLVKRVEEWVGTFAPTRKKAIQPPETTCGM